MSIPSSSLEHIGVRRHPLDLPLCLALALTLAALPACRKDLDSPTVDLATSDARLDSGGGSRDGGDAAGGLDGMASDRGETGASPRSDGPAGDGLPETGEGGPQDGAEEGPLADGGADQASPDLAPDLAPEAPLVTGCGVEAPDLSGITNLDALAIGRDGTIYFAQSGTPGGWLGRLRPGGAAVEARWLTVPNGATLWGLAIDDGRQRLYVSSASGHLIHFVALGAAQPTLQVLTRDVDEPDDLAIGPDGQVYFPDSDNHLYRVSPGGELERVSTRTLGGNRATSLAFASGGQLLVGTLANGPVYRLAVAAGLETSRATFNDFRGVTLGLAVDVQGGVLAINQVPGSEAQVLRFGADGLAGAVVGTGTALTALAFGRGALSCRDLYLASKSGPLRRVSTAVGGPPAP